MNESGDGQHRRSSSGDEQYRILGRRELDGARLDSPHRGTVCDVEGLVLGKAATEHVALAAKLLNFPLKRRDSILCVTSELGKLVDVAFGTALGQRR